MPVLEIHSLKESPHLQIVSVIASFDTEGKVKPLYVRIGTDSYKIATSWLEPGIGNIKTYQCQIEDGNTLKPLKLKHHVQEFMWTIPKEC